MKETTKMSRAVGQLEKMYNTINLDLWGGQLPTPIITVQSKPGTYGHCSVGKVWKRKDADTYEMNIAAEALDVEIEEVLDTLIHEMVHLYCRENGIQEVEPWGQVPQREVQGDCRGAFADVLQGRHLRLEHTGQGQRQVDGVCTGKGLERDTDSTEQLHRLPRDRRERSGKQHTDSAKRGTQTEQHPKADLPEVREQRPSDKGSAHHVYGLHGADAGGVSMTEILLAASVSWCLCGIIFAMDKTD